MAEHRFVGQVIAIYDRTIEIGKIYRKNDPGTFLKAQIAKKRKGARIKGTSRYMAPRWMEGFNRPLEVGDSLEFTAELKPKKDGNCFFDPTTVKDFQIVENDWDRQLEMLINLKF